MLNVLLAKHKNTHPVGSGLEIAKWLLERQGFARCQIGEGREALEGPLDKYDVVVLFCVAEEMSAQEEKNLCDFVKNGGGLVGLHSASDIALYNASDSSAKNRDYLDMLGAKFIDHDPGSGDDGEAMR